MDVSPAIAFIRGNHERYLDELCALIAIPSISADPKYRPDVLRCANLMATLLTEAGLENASVEETSALGNPVVYAEWLHAPGFPTILIYGHYDVQPVDPLELWHSAPFTAEIRDGKIYGRGAVDDKGQVLMHIAALGAHLRAQGRLPINVKVIIEGEEEIGSPHFEKYLAANREKFACDFVVVSDTAVFAENVPSLTTSLRGLVHWDIEVQGPQSDLHSGYFGGIVANPIEILSRMIAQCKDADGRIIIPGFMDDVFELAPEERRELEALPYDQANEAFMLGVPQLAGEAGRHPLERSWFRPTLECNGIRGGYQGPGHKTIIPSYAKAKISARLVPHQDPTHVKAVVTQFLRKAAPASVKVTINADGDVRGVRTSRTHPAMAAAARAMERGFGKKPVFIGTGGTIGPVASFDRVLGLPQVLIGVGLPDDSIHAPNEKFDLQQFFRGIETMAFLYEEIAALN